MFSAPVNGTRRWFNLGGLGIQPSELAKIAAILFTALILERRMHRIDEVQYSLLPILIVAGGMFALIVLEPDYGTAISLLLIVGLMVFAAGLNYRYLLGTAAGRAAGALDRADERGLQAPPAARVLEPRGGSAWRWLSSASVAHRRRHRPHLRQGTDGRRAEALLPARAAHRLHLRGDRRGARSDRRDRHPRVLLRDRVARRCASRSGPRTRSARSSRWA